MKLMLLIGGIAFLLLGVLLCIAAIVVLLMAKKRSGKQPSTAAQSPASPPSTPPVAPAWAAQQPPGADIPTAVSWDPQVPPAPAPAYEAPPDPWSPPAAVPAPPPAAFPAADPFAGDSTLALPLPGREQWGTLNAVTGSLAGKSFPVTAEGFYIGRDSSVAQVVIADGSVSKRHVWVGVRDGEVVAIDEGSTNGTYLNSVGARIQRQPLNPGDTLIISNDIARLVYQR